MAQQAPRTVTGTVTDEKGEGLPGVTVLQRGTTNGQTTSPDGTYSLKLTAGDATLVFSSIGYARQEVVGSQSALNISLAADSKALNDVVVGYGAQRKEDLTGAVASADLKAFRNQPNSNITQSLQGTVPGLNVGQLNSAGGNPSIQIRNFLKVRAGYGTSGNLTSRYSSLARVSSGAAYVFGDGGTTQFGQQVQTLANPNLKWESTRGFNVGLDGVVLNNRLNVTLDLYNNYTNDLLFDVAIPAITGFQTVRTNVGRVNNKGIELTLTSQNIVGQNFTWSTTFNASANQNKIVELTATNPDGSPADLVNNGLFIGRPIQTNYQLQANGIYQLDEKDILAGYYPGNARIVDANGDGKLVFLDDRTFQGHQEPAYRFSVLNTFNYKGFTLTAFINSIHRRRPQRGARPRQRLARVARRGEY